MAHLLSWRLARRVAVFTALTTGCAGTFQLPSRTELQIAADVERVQERLGAVRGAEGRADVKPPFDCGANETWQTFWSGVSYVGGAVGGGSGLSAGGLWESDDGKKNAAIVAGIAALIGGLGTLVQNQVAARGVREKRTQIAIPAAPPGNQPPQPDAN
jgi:hypothetical protein